MPGGSRPTRSPYSAGEFEAFLAGMGDPSRLLRYPGRFWAGPRHNTERTDTLETLIKIAGAAFLAIIALIGAGVVYELAYTAWRSYRHGHPNAGPAPWAWLNRKHRR